MATELGVGYVSILPSTRGFQSALNRQISGSGAVAGAKVSEGFGSSFVGGIKSAAASAGRVISSIASTALKVVKAVAVTGGVGVALFAGAALKGGYDRLVTIEGATKALTIQLGSAAAASKLLGQVNEAALGTPYTLPDMAKATSQMIAFGISAKDVPGYLTAIGDAAAVTGGSADTFAQLSTVFGQVAASGHIYSQDILQLVAAGVPAWNILANATNQTVEATQKAVSKGNILSKDALPALVAGIEHGSNGIARMTSGLGGLAKGLGDTTQGALANFKTAVARMGQSIEAPFFKLGPKLFAALGYWVGVVGKSFNILGTMLLGSKAGQLGFNTFLVRVMQSAPKVADWLLRVGGYLAHIGVAAAPKFISVFKQVSSVVVGVARWLGELGSSLGSIAVTFLRSTPVTEFFDKLRTAIGKIDWNLILVRLVDFASKGQQFLTAFLQGDKVSGFFTRLSTTFTTKLLPALKGLIPAGKNLLTFASNLRKASGTTATGLFVSIVAALPSVKDLVNVLASLIAKVPPNALVAIFGAFATFKVAKGAADGVNGIAEGLGRIKDLGGPFKNAKKNIGTLFDKLGSAKATGLTKVSSGLETVRLRAMYAKDAAKDFGAKIAAQAKLGASSVASLGGKLKDGATAAAGMAKQGLIMAANWVKATAATVAHKVAEIASTVATKAAAAAQWLLNAAMSANPITLIVIGIAALIAGFVLAYQKIGWFRDLVQGAFRIIKTVILGVFNWVKSNWPLLLAILTGPIGIAVLLIVRHWDTIKNAFTAVKNWISDRVGDIVGFITGIPGRISKTVSTMWNGLKTGITSAKNWIEGRINDVVSFVTSLPRRIASSVAGAFDGIRNAFKSALNWVIKKWNAFHLPSVHVPGTDINIGGMGLPHIDELHTGGMVPGPASYEPIYRLQGGEMVLSRDQVKALGTAPQPRAGVTFGPTYVTDPTDVDTLFQKAGWALARGAL